MKDKTIFIILIGFSIMLLFVLFVFAKSNSFKKTMDPYIVHYRIGYYRYDLEAKKNYILVSKNEIVFCDQAPCNPILEEQFKVLYTKENRNFFEYLFQDKVVKEINITDKDLDSEQIIILYKLIRENYQISNLSYELLPSHYYTYDYSEKGYYLENMEDGQLKVIVSMGLQHTGGYSLSIQNIHIIHDDVYIYVKEEYPSKDSIVTMASETPNIQLLFNRKPNSIVVQNVDNDEYYKEISD